MKKLKIPLVKPVYIWAGMISAFILFFIFFNLYLQNTSSHNIITNLYDTYTNHQYYDDRVKQNMRTLQFFVETYISEKGTQDLTLKNVYIFAKTNPQHLSLDFLNPYTQKSGIGSGKAMLELSFNPISESKDFTAGLVLFWVPKEKNHPSNYKIYGTNWNQVMLRDAKGYDVFELHG